MDVLDDPRDRRFELLALHVGGERGGSAIAGRSGDGHRPAQALAHLGDRRRGALVGGVDPALVVGEGAGQDRQLVAQVVEDEQQRR